MPRLTRRQLLQGTALGIGSAAAGSVLTAGTVAAQEDDERIAGEVVQTISPSTLLLRREDGVTFVQFSEDATYWRDEECDLRGNPRSRSRLL